MGLEEGEDLGEALVTEVLKDTEHAGPEEDLGVSDLVGVLLQVEGLQDLLCHDLAINEARGDGVGGQDGVPAGEGAELVMRGVLTTSNNTVLCTNESIQVLYKYGLWIQLLWVALQVTILSYFES